jgi:hypothetical protein
MRHKITVREKHNYVGTPTYRSWYNMKSRCNNPKYTNSKLWHGKGIIYDPRWERFTLFLADMGERPPGTSLDRIDGNKGYCKENCRWATRIEQSNNTSRNHYIEYRGNTMTLTQLAAEHGLKQPTLRKRLSRGWPLEQALKTPLADRGQN